MAAGLCIHPGTGSNNSRDFAVNMRTLALCDVVLRYPEGQGDDALRWLLGKARPYSDDLHGIRCRVDWRFEL